RCMSVNSHAMSQNLKTVKILIFPFGKRRSTVKWLYERLVYDYGIIGIDLITSHYRMYPEPDSPVNNTAGHTCFRHYQGCPYLAWKYPSRWPGENVVLFCR